MACHKKASFTYYFLFPKSKFTLKPAQTIRKLVTHHNPKVFQHPLNYKCETKQYIDPLQKLITIRTSTNLGTSTKGRRLNKSLRTTRSCTMYHQCHPSAPTKEITKTHYKVLEYKMTKKKKRIVQ